MYKKEIKALGTEVTDIGKEPDVKRCPDCLRLESVIENLTEMLLRAQRSRRKAYSELRMLQRLLILDMEAAHALSADLPEDRIIGR